MQELIHQRAPVRAVRRARIGLGQPEQRFAERLFRRKQGERLLDVELQPAAPGRKGSCYGPGPFDLARRRTGIPV
ncbi:MAG TPA: hypothetical protein VFZ84_18515 [Burkholderiales bacterium]